MNIWLVARVVAMIVISHISHNQLPSSDEFEEKQTFFFSWHRLSEGLSVSAPFVAGGSRAGFKNAQKLSRKWANLVFDFVDTRLHASSTLFVI